MTWSGHTSEPGRARDLVPSPWVRENLGHVVAPPEARCLPGSVTDHRDAAIATLQMPEPACDNPKDLSVQFVECVL
jgi:hypothetical protein